MNQPKFYKCPLKQQIPDGFYWVKNIEIPSIYMGNDEFYEPGKKNVVILICGHRFIVPGSEIGSDIKFLDEFKSGDVLIFGPLSGPDWTQGGDYV